MDIKIEADLNDQLSYSYKEDIMSRFTNDDLGMLPNNEIFARDTLFMDDEDNDSNENRIDIDCGEIDDIIILHIDIREPIIAIKTLLEQKLGVSLIKYEFWLQDAQILEPHKNLVDQCVKGEGLVQINTQVRTATKRINIVDVLKPTDDALAELSNMMNEDVFPNSSETPSDEIQSNTIPPDEITNHTPENTNEAIASTSSMDEDSSKSESIKWIADSNFKKDLARLKIPENPKEWTVAQVRHWLQWAVRQFNLSNIKLQDWNIPGNELFNISLEDFRQKVPHDPENIFWTHIQLIRKCNMVAVRVTTNDDEELSECIEALTKKVPRAIGPKHLKPIKPMAQIPQFGVDWNSNQGNRTGNNGQIQLWQFLLEILTDREHRNIITWLGGQGEFKLSDPERVAQLWGERKNKPTMNYEKLSRALRYYYDGDMISKVHNKRFVYKFVCDLTQLVGYNAQELSNLVNEVDNDSKTMYKDIMGD